MGGDKPKKPSTNLKSPINKTRSGDLKIVRNDDNLIIIKMKGEMDELRSRITKLETQVEMVKSQQAIATIVSDRLKEEVDTLQQYSRRNCLVINGIPTNRNESNKDVEEKVKSIIKNELQLPDYVSSNYINDLDKAQ